MQNKIWEVLKIITQKKKKKRREFKEGLELRSMGGT